jgi:hypothetical protein
MFGAGGVKRMVKESNFPILGRSLEVMMPRSVRLLTSTPKSAVVMKL